MSPEPAGFVPFDESECEPTCPALCDHFEAWYRAGMSRAWKQVGEGLRGISATLERGLNQ